MIAKELNPILVVLGFLLLTACSGGSSDTTEDQTTEDETSDSELQGADEIYGGSSLARDSQGAIISLTELDPDISCSTTIPEAAVEGVNCIDENYTNDDYRGAWSWRGAAGAEDVGLYGPRGTGVHAWGSGGELDAFKTDESFAMSGSEDNAQDPLGAIGARQAYSLGLTGAGVKVAVVDTSLDTDHSELSEKIISQYDACGEECSSFFTGTGDHGTHVAGIIAAKSDGNEMHGVAYDADLVSIYFAETFGGGLDLREEKLADGITAAVADGARIFNNSWGSSSNETNDSLFDDDYLRGAVADAIDQGSVFVWAAGNSYEENTDLGANNTSQEAKAALKYSEEFASGFVNVVNLVYDNEAKEWVISNSLSNSDEEANSQVCGVTKNYCLGAPGTNINSSVAGDDYATLSGTSMAAPMVSGGIAILFQAFPYVETSDILDLLFVTADDLGAEGVDEIYGHGMMNLAAALEPSGPLTLATSGSTQTNSGLSLSGASLSGDTAFVGAISSAASDMVALDSFDRAYAVGATGMTVLSQGEPHSASTLSESLRLDFDQLASFGTPIAESAMTGGDTAVAMKEQISLSDGVLNYRAVTTDTSSLAEVQYVAMSTGENWQMGQSISITQEQGQLFGNVGTGAYALADTATTLTVGSNGSRQLAGDWTLFGGVGVSQTAVDPAVGSLIALSDQITSASAVMGLRRDQLGDDQMASFALQVSQDRLVLAGSALTTIPVGRDEGGVILLEETRLDEQALSIVPTVEMTYESQIDLDTNLAYSVSASELENTLAVDLQRAF